MKNKTSPKAEKGEHNLMGWSRKLEMRQFTRKKRPLYCKSVIHEIMLLRDGDESNGVPLKKLDERTAQFGEAIITFAKRIPATPVNKRLIEQLVGAGTSVGANYCEADDSISGKEFKQKICICRKESKETMFFLRMIAVAEEQLANEARALWREAKELNLIFGAIWRK